MRSLGLGSLGSVELSDLILPVFRHRLRGTPDGSGANLFDDRVIVVGHIDLGRGQCGGAFSRLHALLIVVIVIERVEQTDAEPVITVIVARHRQPGHGLAFFHGRSRAECPHGLLGQRLFHHRLRFVRRLRHLRSPSEFLFGMFFKARRLRRDCGSECSKVQALQIIWVVERPSGRKVNSEKLLCQRLGRRLAAGTWGIGLVHNH